MGEPVIEVHDLWFTYPSGVTALRGVSMRIHRGELVAIVGENGAGKTTLVKHFIGLLKPERGYVKVFGMDTREVSVATLAMRVGFVFQNPDYQLFAETVWDEVAFALKNFGFSEEEVERRVSGILRRLDLERYRDKSPLSLSGGERKRVALASVLCYDPEVIVFDEPTIGQDYRQKSRIASMLKKFVAEGRTVVVVTHDMEFVAEHVPRTIVMAKGRVIIDASTRDVFANRVLLEAASLYPTQTVEVGLKLGISPPPLTVEELVEALVSRRFAP